MRFAYFFTITLFISSLLSSCGGNVDRSKQPKPNILFIMTDDHAMQALSAYGHPISKLAPTPNIDRLAQEGTLFLENYCANSICGPSRATVLTGKHSHANGFVKNDGTKFNGHQPTIPNILQKNGYQTAVIGKWHLNTKPVGFNYYKILNDQGEYINPDFITKDTMTQEMGYVTDLITESTIDWLDNRDEDQPFFLMMQHKAPHRNWIPAEKYYHLFEDVEFPVPNNYFDNYDGRLAAAGQEMNIYRDAYEGHDLKMVTGVNSDTLLYDRWPQVFFGRMTEEERKRFLEAYRERNNDYYLTERTEEEKAVWKLQRYLQDYLACVRSVDDSVGEMYEYLEEKGLLDNTIVIYTSDQGFFLGEHGWFDKRWMYEESFRMPLIIRDPYIKEKGKSISELTQNIDFAPTILQMAGVEIPNEMQGESFLPLMSGDKKGVDWRKSLYYHYYEYPGFHSVKAHNGVKTDQYKLIHFYNDDVWELYDLQEDPDEMNNIYDDIAYEEVKYHLHNELERLIIQYQVSDKYLH
ncbi:sulfatase family protein [Carboxylicivirga linearis]|uniref:Sulfatase n=1 Tax=Carboxylicivirga linearis TaxID=1628157 RepID=A0ABS5JZI6_9BACT|nr:sulfatase [Carboxylicivirga linearis]MBS2099731.1 sulfatase [Carboxylicivirga linearis]